MSILTKLKDSPELKREVNTMRKIVLIGDAFTDYYYFGTAERLSPEAPVPVLDVEREEIRLGGVLNVAMNCVGLGLPVVVYTITDLQKKCPFKVISPSTSSPLVKARFIVRNQQLLRVDKPKVYKEADLKKFREITPDINKEDLVALIDYDKGVVQGGKAHLVDSKKKDLSVFQGSQILKVNKKEYDAAIGKENFPEAYVTAGPEGIFYYRNGSLINSMPTDAKEVIDVTGAGDTVTATILFCLFHGITNPSEIMELANKAAGIVISRLGTSYITTEELLS